MEGYLKTGFKLPWREAGPPDHRDDAVVENSLSESVWLQGCLQGYLAHKQHPAPLGPRQGPRHRPTVES